MSKPHGTILVVDDEPIIRLLLHDVLVKDGYQVLEAKDGQTSVGSYKSHRDEIDLVILDLKLPDVDGVTVLGELKEIDGDVQVVIITGNLDVDDIPGTLAMLRKPFRIPELRSVVHGIVG